MLHKLPYSITACYGNPISIVASESVQEKKWPRQAYFISHFLMSQEHGMLKPFNLRPALILLIFPTRRRSLNLQCEEIERSASEKGGHCTWHCIKKRAYCTWHFICTWHGIKKKAGRGFISHFCYTQSTLIYHLHE